MTGADNERLSSDLLAAQVDTARAQSLLEAIKEKRAPSSLATLIPHASSEQQQAAQRWVQGQYIELQSTVEQSAAAIEQRSAEIESAKSTVASLQQSLPITRELAADYKRLLKKNFIAKHAYLEKEQIRLDQERELSIQKSRVLELGAAKKAAQSQRSSVIAQTRRAMLDLKHVSEQRSTALSQELKKAQQRDSLMRLTAPVVGTVQQLTMHTNGGVVTEGQPLMVIVLSDQPVEIEAMLENKDIGFVRPGQSVEIKVETFSFTKYGVVDGTVVSISNDAIEDECLGVVYGVRIQLKQNSIQVGTNKIALSPGMAVRAEEKTDKRKVVDYFLSPLK